MTTAAPQYHVQSTHHVNNDDDEEEYEYEYDTTQTDDFYFTLDLTTHVPNALAPQPPAQNGSSSTPANTTSNSEGNQGNGTSSHDTTTSSAKPSRPSDHVQFLDLHTTNPLIKFNNDVYSCSWSTDLGSQFHITQTGVTATPLRRGNVLDVVALSRTRLLGKPVTLNPRATPNGPAINPPLNTPLPQRKTVPVVDSAALRKDDDDDINSPEPSDDDEPTTTPIPNTTTTDQSQTITTTPGLPLSIPPTYRTNPIAASQATFLTSLSKIKLSKGELDQVPVYAIKNYIPPSPSHASHLRSLALASDSASGQDISVALMLQRNEAASGGAGPSLLSGREASRRSAARSKGKGREAKAARVGTGFESRTRRGGKGSRNVKVRSGEDGRGRKVEFGMGKGAGRASRVAIRNAVGFLEEEEGEEGGGGGGGERERGAYDDGGEREEDAVEGGAEAEEQDVEMGFADPAGGEEDDLDRDGANDDVSTMMSRGEGLIPSGPRFAPMDGVERT